MDIEITELKDKIIEMEQVFRKLHPDEKQLSEMRNDILYKVNIKGVKPKPSTLNQYNIQYDDRTGMYFHDATSSQD